MRLGLFGGSFDPAHNGHLALAEACRAQARLDEVWFVPTAVQPHKPRGPVASNTARVAMLQAAITGREGMQVSTIEIDRGGISYTIDTLREVRRQQPDAELFLLMGADTLADLPKWREPGAILRLAVPLVVRRPGEPAPDLSVLASVVAGAASPPGLVVEMPAFDISSSRIRQTLATGESVADFCPVAVVEYLVEHRPYRA